MIDDFNKDGNDYVNISFKVPIGQTLQYTFYCPFKCFAEHCMVGYGEAAVTRWKDKGMSFCQWVGSKLGCSKFCDCDFCKCSNPAPEENEWFTAFCASCRREQPENSECPDCVCKEQLQTLCSKFNDLTCTCAKDICWLNVCERCNCLSTSESEPITCPTFEVRVSRNLQNVLLCPSCPEHVSCLSISEDQSVNCCCHYVFFNRCGDPQFSYDNQKSACTWRADNICTFILQALRSLGRCLCLCSFGLCENSVRCCFQTSLLCSDLVCCKCSNERFCKQFTFFCLDCNEVQTTRNVEIKGKPENISDDNVSSRCSCACFICKPCEKPAILETLNTEVEVQVSSTTTSDSIEFVGREYCVENSMLEPNQRKEKIIGTEHINIINEKKQSFTESDSGSRGKTKKSKTETAVKRKKMNRISVKQDRSNGEKVNGEEAHISNEVENEGESYIDFEHMKKLQVELLRRNSYDNETFVEETSEESEASEPRRTRRYLPDRGHEFDGKQGNPDVSRKNSHSEGCRTGILKTHSSFSTDFHASNPETAFSIFDETLSQKRSKKHAHFANEDEALVKELFPRSFPESSSDDKMVHERNKVRKKKRKKANDGAVILHNTSSDDSEMNKSIKVKKTKTKSSTSRRKSNTRQAYSSDEDTVEFGTSNKSNRKHLSHPSNHDNSSFLPQRVGRHKYKHSKAKNEEANVCELVDYASSDEEVSAKRYINVGSKQTKKGSTAKVSCDEMLVESLDDLSDKEDEVGSRDKKNKRVGQRLKEIKQRRLSSDNSDAHI